jgi:hypothetical protein
MARIVAPDGSLASEEPLVKLRAHQVEPFWREDLGIMVLSWRRRGGKSFMMAAKALRDMMIKRGILNIFMSASITLGQEFIRKEWEVWTSVLSRMRQLVAGKMLIESNIDDVDVDAFCDIFEHSKLEVKIRHDRTTESRSKVIAPNPDTAVGFGGWLYVDEFGRIQDFKGIVEAVLPFIEDHADFRAVWASTPPPDDKHYSYELTAPPTDDFPVNPKGNWYVSSAGFDVHRVDAFDAYAGGMPMRDLRTREEITPEEHRRRSFDKAAWDRNYGVRYLPGGTSALALHVLHNAMVRGADEGVATNITEQIVLEGAA